MIRAHEFEEKEIAKETKKIDFGGSLALILKTTSKQVCSNIEAEDNKEGMFMNFGDEVVAYYSNNSVKKFYKKPIGGNFKKTVEKAFHKRLLRRS